MEAKYDYGQEVRLTLSFFDADAVTELDPDSIALKIMDPTGEETDKAKGDLTPDPDHVGRYFYDLIVDIEGRWYYRVEGSGAVQAAAEKSFLVKDSRFY